MAMVFNWRWCSSRWTGGEGKIQGQGMMQLDSPPDVSSSGINPPTLPAAFVSRDVMRKRLNVKEMTTVNNNGCTGETAGAVAVSSV